MFIGRQLSFPLFGGLVISMFWRFVRLDFVVVFYGSLTGCCRSQTTGWWALDERLFAWRPLPWQPLPERVRSWEQWRDLGWLSGYRPCRHDPESTCNLNRPRRKLEREAYVYTSLTDPSVRATELEREILKCYRLQCSFRLISNNKTLEEARQKKYVVD